MSPSLNKKSTTIQAKATQKTTHNLKSSKSLLENSQDLSISQDIKALSLPANLHTDPQQSVPDQTKNNLKDENYSQDQNSCTNSLHIKSNNKTKDSANKTENDEIATTTSTSRIAASSALEKCQPGLNSLNQILTTHTESSDYTREISDFTYLQPYPTLSNIQISNPELHPEFNKSWKVISEAANYQLSQLAASSSNIPYPLLESREISDLNQNTNMNLLNGIIPNVNVNNINAINLNNVTTENSSNVYW